jgi:acyl carrier protein
MQSAVRETITKIRKFILENFMFTDDEAALRNEDSFLEKGIIDSTGMLELMAFISDEFHTTIDDDEIIPDNLDSVNHVASFILTKKTGNI